MIIRSFYNLLFTIVLVFGFSIHAAAEEPTPHGQQSEERKANAAHPDAEETKKEKAAFNPGEVIMEHISDSYEWHFASYKGRDYSFCLPVILYSPGKGLSIFSSGKFHHGHDTYKGYKLVDRKILTEDGSRVFDFSITKNVLQMLIGVFLLLFIMLSVARNYKKYGTKAPRGIQSVIEIIVIFIRDQVAKPMLGEKYKKYLPYLLTLFFFIWINNLLGLFPGAANVTGNIAVTATLAIFTFILMMAGSKRHYWSHMIAPKGIPVGVWPILIPIEIISNLIVKPVALMIRLFANMLAGHLIVLSFLSLIFIFAAMSAVAGIGTSIFSVAFSIFIYLLELLVAALQAYIFTVLSALFIGETAPSHHQDHKTEPH